MVTLRATAVYPAASMGLVIGTGLVAFFIATAFWAVSQHASTLAHEGGHALAATILGVSVHRLVVMSNGDGLTTRADASKNANILIGLSGYTGPSVFGLVGAILLNTGRVASMLWLSLFFLALAMIVCHSWFTAGIILATGGLIYLIVSNGNSGLQQFFGYTWVWFLLVAGLRDVMQLAPIKRNATGPGGDSIKLREATKVPTQVFVGCFGIFSFVALIVGALILVRAIN
jgi:hypothetical protein